MALGIVGLISGALFAQIGAAVFVVPTVVAIIGCGAGILLLRGWDGAALWTDDAEAPASPTAPAAAR